MPQALPPQLSKRWYDEWERQAVGHVTEEKGGRTMKGGRGWRLLALI